MLLLSFLFELGTCDLQRGELVALLTQARGVVSPSVASGLERVAPLVARDVGELELVADPSEVVDQRPNAIPQIEVWTSRPPRPVGSMSETANERQLVGVERHRGHRNPTRGRLAEAMQVATWQ